MTIIQDGTGNSFGTNNPLPITNVTSAPVLITSIPFSALIPSGSYYKTVGAVLNRNIKQRTLVIANSTDIAITTSYIYFHDSAIPNLSNKTSVSLNNASNNGISVTTSEKIPELSSHLDSCMFSFGIGATAPTTGTIDVYLVEVK